jgi:hypothetical protein
MSAPARLAPGRLLGQGRVATLVDQGREVNVSCVERADDVFLWLRPCNDAWESLAKEIGDVTDDDTTFPLNEPRGFSALVKGAALNDSSAPEILGDRNALRQESECTSNPNQETHQNGCSKLSSAEGQDRPSRPDEDIAHRHPSRAQTRSGQQVYNSQVNQVQSSQPGNHAARIWTRKHWNALLAQLRAESSDEEFPVNKNPTEPSTTTQDKLEYLSSPATRDKGKQKIINESNTWVRRLYPTLPHSAYNPYPNALTASPHPPSCSAPEIDYTTLGYATNRKILSQAQHHHALSESPEGCGLTLADLEEIDNKLHLYLFKQYKQEYREMLGEYDIVTDRWITGLGRRADWVWTSTRSEQKQECACVGMDVVPSFDHMGTSDPVKSAGAALLLLFKPPGAEIDADASTPASLASEQMLQYDSTPPQTPSSPHSIFHPNPYTTMSSEPWGRDIERAGACIPKTCRSVPAILKLDEVKNDDGSLWETSSELAEADSDQISAHYSESSGSQEGDTSWDADSSIRPSSSATRVQDNKTSTPKTVRQDIIHSAWVEPSPRSQAPVDIPRLSSLPIFTYTAPFPPPKFQLRRSPPTAPYMDLLSQITGDEVVSCTAPRVSIRRRDSKALLSGSARILPVRKRQGLAGSAVAKTYGSLQAEIGGMMVGEMGDVFDILVTKRR